MDKLDAIRQKIEADREQDATRAKELEELRKQDISLDKQIDEAIKNGQTGTAERLIINQNEIRGKIAIAERISSSKAAPDAYYDDLLAINAEFMKEMQSRVDKATAEMEKARRAYLEKMINLEKVVYEAAHFRMECGVLAGIGSLAMNPRFGTFDKVEFTANMNEFTRSENEQIRQMEPEYFAIMNEINFGLR